MPHGANINKESDKDSSRTNRDVHAHLAPNIRSFIMEIVKFQSQSQVRLQTDTGQNNMFHPRSGT